MMMSETTSHLPSSRARFPEFAALAGRLNTSLIVWRERHAWRKDLRRFDDRMLADSGMDLAGAEVQIAEPFWRR